jgi:hypothetical protein
MANALYPKFKEALLNQAAGTSAINLSSDTNIKVALVNISGSTNAYTYSSSHQYFSSVSTNSAAVVGTSATLANKTVATPAGGVFDADDVTFTGVSGTNVIGALVIYKDTGTAASSPLIAFLDSGTGLSITPNGGSVTVSWDSGANRIFAL